MSKGSPALLETGARGPRTEGDWKNSVAERVLQGGATLSRIEMNHFLNKSVIFNLGGHP